MLMPKTMLILSDFTRMDTGDQFLHSLLMFHSSFITLFELMVTIATIQERLSNYTEATKRVLPLTSTKTSLSKTMRGCDELVKL